MLKYCKNSAKIKFTNFKNERINIIKVATTYLYANTGKPWRVFTSLTQYRVLYDCHTIIIPLISKFDKGVVYATIEDLDMSFYGHILFLFMQYKKNVVF